MTKVTQIQVKVNTDDKLKIKLASAVIGLRPSTFMRTLALERANEILHKEVQKG